MFTFCSGLILTLMLICAKIYNMETYPNPNPAESPIEFSQIPEIARERLEDPEQVSKSIDALMQHLATPEALRSALEESMLRQAELYQKSLRLRDEGESLSKAEHDELDRINEVHLGLKWISDNYLSDK